MRSFPFTDLSLWRLQTEAQKQTAYINAVQMCLAPACVVIKHSTPLLKTTNRWTTWQNVTEANRLLHLSQRPYGIDLPYIVVVSTEASCSVFRWMIYRPSEERSALWGGLFLQKTVGITMQVIEKDHQIICKGRGRGRGEVRQYYNIDTVYRESNKG